ncbi:ABC transporter ATP-binding protein, partial [Mesorhizobium sp. M00.F.Ca.ET.038.03.1.1]
MRIEPIRPAGGRPAPIRHHDDLISAQGVSVTLAKQLVLQNINLAVPKGSFVSL